MESHKKELHDTWYTITGSDGGSHDTESRREARVAIERGQAVTQETRRVFYVGKSHVRVYVSSEIDHPKDL